MNALPRIDRNLELRLIFAELSARLVLLDLNLPGLNGMGVLRRLAEEKLLQRTRVIMLTLRATEAEVLSTLEMGAFEHVGKPFYMPILMQRIRRALDAVL